MTRTWMLCLAAVGLVLGLDLALALAGARVAGAADDAAAWTECPPEVAAAVQRSVPRADKLRCHKTQVQRVGNQVIAGSIDQVTAEAVLPGGKLAHYELTADGRVRRVIDAHSDLVGSSGKGMAVMFWLFALASVAGAVFVITRRNLIAAVMGMVGSFLGIAAIYMMLYAQFLAVVQMLVYAGAIMVLFVFVVMILNRPEDEPVAPSGRIGQALGGVAILYLVGRLILMLMNVQPADPVIAAAAPGITPEGHDWGSTGAVGTDLFGPGLFPFEAISVLLLVAVVGAIAIARPLHGEDDAPAKTREEGAA